MARPPKNATRIPTYGLHKATGHARVFLDGRYHALGKHGTPESRAKYDGLVADWLARGRAGPTPPPPTSQTRTTPPTVGDVVSAFWTHADAYYRDASGRTTREPDNFRDALRPVLTGHIDDPAASFGPTKLRKVRASMLASGLARSTVNARVGRIRRVFTWAASHELIPATVSAALATVEPLRAGAGKVRESKPITGVDPEIVAATLPHLPRPVAGLVQFMLATGARVGEAVIVRTCDVVIDADGRGGTYTPTHHKNLHRGLRRVVHLGPRALEALQPFLRPDDPNAFIFNPADAIADEFADRKIPKHLRRVAPKYTRQTLLRAIDRGCDRAFPHPTIEAIRPSDRTAEQRAELRAWRRDHRWSPLQLRHEVAQRVRDRHGLEAAAAVLGHAGPSITADRYAKQADKLAADVAREDG